MSKLKKTLVISILAGLGGVLGAVESMLPIFAQIPGGKLGIANIVTVVVLYGFGNVPAILVSCIRTVVTSMLYGGVNAFMYSFAGAILSTGTMIFFKTILKEKVTPVGISVVGAAFHNTGQIVVAFMVLQSKAVFSYLGVLLLISVVSGATCGYCSKETLKRIKGLII